MTFFRRFRHGLAAVLLACLLAPAALAARPGDLSAADKADIARVEAYLNSITTLHARFLQVGPDGGQAEGEAWISRPGRLRLSYDPPVPAQIYAEDGFLVHYDTELETTSYIPLNETPAGVLVQPQIRLNGDGLKVTRVARAPGMVGLTVVRSKDPGSGEITLVFSESPFVLKQWRVVDSQGGVTQVSLYDARTGIAIDPKVFQFRDPNFANPIQR